MIAGLALSLMAGVLIGAANYLALWATVRRLPSARRPAALSALSFLMRTAAVAAGFYIVTGGDPARLSACVLGLILVRTASVRRVLPSKVLKGGIR